MIRILMFLLALVVAAALITLISNMSGYVEGRAFGFEIYWPVSVVVGMVLIGAMGLIGLTIFAKDLAALPEKLRRKRADMRREKGLVALTRGLEAVAAGDPGDAQRHARTAKAMLEDPNLTRLLTAQAAALAGEEAEATQAFSAMLEAPETEFLGLRGLYAQALAKGDMQAAKDYAERAFRLRPGAKWAFDSVYQLSVERAAWGDAREAIKSAARHGIAADDVARRRQAVLLTASAYTAHDSDDDVTALTEAEAALKLEPAFTPAATLAAQLLHQRGKDGKAMKLIETAWEKSPHPALAKAASRILEDNDLAARRKKLRRLAGLNPHHKESKFLLAAQFIEEEEWQQAREIIEPMLEENSNARMLQAMAEIMKNLYGEAKAAPWLVKAATAPQDHILGADGAFHITTAGWQRLLEEYGEHQRLSPPPIEELSTGIDRTEILRLTAPPEEVVPGPEKLVPANEPAPQDDGHGPEPSLSAVTPETPAREEEPAQEKPGDAIAPPADFVVPEKDEA